jgi:hypothetical protein
MSKNKKCTPEIQIGRLNKAEQFLRAAEIISTSIDDSLLADAYVTLCVHAGIAASDAICCARLGEHSVGSDHRSAVALLAQIDEVSSSHLKVLLDMKGHAGYSEHQASSEVRISAGVSATELVKYAKLA